MNRIIKCFLCSIVMMFISCHAIDNFELSDQSFKSMSSLTQIVLISSVVFYFIFLVGFASRTKIIDFKDLPTTGNDWTPEFYPLPDYDKGARVSNFLGFVIVVIVDLLFIIFIK